MKGLYNQMAENDSHGKEDFTRRERLIMEYAPLVKYIANRVAMRLPPHIEVADLVNAGILGLIAFDHLTAPGNAGHNWQV